jgi:hypothetical protein
LFEKSDVRVGDSSKVIHGSVADTGEWKSAKGVKRSVEIRRLSNTSGTMGWARLTTVNTDQ